MTRSLTRKAALVATLAIAAMLSAPRTNAQDADPAVQQIEKFYSALVAGMKDGPKLGTQGRYDKLKPVIEEVFDIPTMTRFVVGPSWTTMTPADREALIAAFERMTVADYAANFNRYEGERFPVEPTPDVRGPDKVVKSKLLLPDGDEIIFNYRMRQAGGMWKIIDIFLSGYVSQLTTRRSDFAATVAEGGAPALLKKIDALADKSLAGG